MKGTDTMADSLFSSLLASIDKQSLSGIAGAVGEPDQLVSHGLRSSIATLLGSIASKSEDHSMLRSILNLAPSTPDVAWSQGAAAIADPNSPLIAGGRRALSALFGTSESAVTSAVSRDSGLRFGVTSKLLAMAAPVVLGFLSKRARDYGLSMSGLGEVLQQESGTIRNALPPGVAEMFWPRPATGFAPTFAQPVEAKKPSYRWAGALAIAAAALGLFWLLNHARHRGAETASIPTGTASRMATGSLLQVTLPNNVKISVPEQGVETRFLTVLQNPGNPAAQNAWLTFDRVLFHTGTATLRPDSEEQLRNVAAIMAAYPNVRLKIGGFTDNQGDADRNLKLSQARADAVMAQLIRFGVSPDRLQAVGYGGQFPVADNGTEQGREQNRRVSMLVTQR
jgi:OmpA-OmpF porin, OOP family